MDFLLNLHPYETEHRKKHQALYHALRDAIRKGQLQQGDRLPATRSLANRYHLSRGTVTLVYDMLWADGYIEAQKGSGTYVAYQTPDQTPPKTTSKPVSLSTWGQRLKAIPQAGNPQHQWSFLGGAPLPQREWTKALRNATRNIATLMGDRITPTEGLFHLREAIAAHLNRARGLTIQANDIIITNGSQQALALLIQLLIDPNDAVVIEDPSYSGTRSAIATTGGQIVPASVDHNGMIVDNWDAKLAIVTPGHQFPTGVVLQRNRRLALLDWAEKQNAIVVEDDYDSDFRRHGRPIEPLKVLDTHNRVAYIGTYSRAFNRALRIGYIILPPDLKAHFIHAKQTYEPQPTALLEQQAMASFMKQGHYERYLRRMARIYAHRYDHLIDLFNTYLPQAFTWTQSEVGTYLFGWWNGSNTDLQKFQHRCEQHHVTWYDPMTCFINNKKPGALFGLARLNDEQMETAIKLMADCY